MITLLAILSFTAPLEASEVEEKESSSVFFHKISEKALYLGAGTLFKSVSSLAKVGWGVSCLSSVESSAAHECLLLSSLATSVSEHFFSKQAHPSSYQSSWSLNEQQLSTISASSEDEEALLSFLKNHFLAKSTGFFPVLVKWVYPRFGIQLQVHPDTTSSYARSPFIGLSKTYQKSALSWKELLPHPKDYPLILTRPADLGEYLPSYHKAKAHESMQETALKIKTLLSSHNAKATLDLTSIIPSHLNWLTFWQAYQRPFLEACRAEGINPERILFIQQVKQKDVGGLRILPLSYASEKATLKQHQFLLGWISTFGLSANRIELDRASSITNKCKGEVSAAELPHLSKESFLSYLNTYDLKSKSLDLQKMLMINGALSSLKSLVNENLSKSQWKKIISSSARLSIVELSFFKIQEKLDLLEREGNSISFFDTASHVEEIHAHISALLELFSPFSFEEFAPIYQSCLTSSPESLKPLTSCALHASAMASLAGIFQAVHKTLGKEPRVLYGENTYYECINAANLISNASPSLEASHQDLKDVDIILAQFNPVWKGAQISKTEYKIENVSDVVRSSLDARNGKPLFLALDCTFDFTNSLKVSNLLHEFQTEIEDGILSVLCYRSGLKFDLFGMDNYCGAPFYMVHSKDPKWNILDELLTDPALRTDSLSLNWFCLAYQNAAKELELYQKQIFDNTQALLDKIPTRLLHGKDLHYRVIPFQKGAETAFIDITITGPLHKIKAEALISGYLTLKCIEQGFPLFYRISIGLYHTNLTRVLSDECSTIRLTLGLDPAQVDVLAECFKYIDTLNGPYP